MRHAGSTFSLAFIVLATLVGAATARGDCPDQPFDVFAREGYHVRDVRLAGLLLRGGALRDAMVVATALKPGAPVSNAEIEAGKAYLREQLRAAPSLFESRVAATVIVADVEACDPATRQLDVVYSVFTTRVPLVISRFGEQQQARDDDPAGQLALAPTPEQLRIAPRVSYDRARGLMGGATLSVATGTLFDRLTVDADASRSATLLDAGARSIRERETGWLRVYDWRVAYHHADRPTDQSVLKARAFVTHLTAASRPLGGAGAIVRMASLLEAGEQRSTLSSGLLPEGYVAATGYGSWKNAIGVDVRAHRQGLRAGYGLQLGMSRGRDAIDYVKQVMDVAYDARVGWKAPAWSHRPLDIAAVWSAGHLGGGDAVPVTERFFGGAASTPFLPGAGWALSGNPVLRSFPPQWFNRADAASAAVGATQYQTLNVTASMPLLGRPLVPSSVLDEPRVLAEVDGQLDSAQQVIDDLYRQTDPAYLTLLERAPTLDAHLAAFDARLVEIADVLPAESQDVVDTCRGVVDDIRAQLDSERKPRPYLAALFLEAVDESDPTLPGWRAICLTRLAAASGDDALQQAGALVAREADTMETLMRRIDTTRAQKLAARDMTFPRQVVNSIFHEMNLWSLGPVVMFDAARIGLGDPAGRSAARYAFGGGLRFTVASTFHMTAGYVWNLNRASREPRGATYLTMELTGPFGF